MKKTPIILAILSIFAISLLYPVHRLDAAVPGEPAPLATSGELVQKKSQLKAAELPPAIAQLLELPAKPIEAVEKSVETTGRPQVLTAPERAGFKRYYEEGRGFKVTDFLSLSGRVEIFEDYVPIDSLIMASQEQSLRGMNNLQVNDTLTDKEIRHSFTRAEAGQAILKFKNDWPVLRYTYDYRQLYRIYDEDMNDFKELAQQTHEFFFEYTIPYRLPVLGQWTLNAGYNRIRFHAPHNAYANERRDKWIFNNAFQVDKEREIFFAYEYFEGKHMSAPWKLKPDQHYWVFQWRQRFPDWRLYSVSNYSVTRELFSPDTALYAKHEIFQEFNKDITEQLRLTQRTTYIYARVANSNFRPDKVHAQAFVGRVKISYELFKDFDVSMAYQHSWGLTLSTYDNAYFLWEGEIFKPGLIRTSVGYFWQRFYRASSKGHKDENGIQFRAFVFQ